MSVATVPLHNPPAAAAPPVAPAAPAEAAVDDPGAAAAAEVARLTREAAEEAPPAEGAPTPDIEPAPDAPAASEIPEETLRAAAFKFANRTMAAARRAEERATAVKNENTTLKGNLQLYSSFVERLQKGDASALAEIGFGSFKAFAEAVANHGETPSDPNAPPPWFEKWRKEQEGARQQTDQQAKVEAAQREVFTALDADKTRWRYTATEVGHDLLWESIGEYYKLHGDIPDDRVPLLADQVEKYLRAQMGAPDSAPRPGENNGATASPPAAGVASKSGKTLAGRPMSGAPAPQVLSMDDDESRRQAQEILRAQGVLNRPPG